jgi:hypothetical protein
MISLIFHLHNPWRKEEFSNLYCKSGLISKHKAWEFEIYNHTPIVLSAQLVLNFRTDHAGLTIDFGMFGYEASFKIYDTRHWDRDLNKWEDHDAPI